MNRSLSILVVGSVLLSGCAHAFGPPAATVDGRAVTEAAVQNELDLVLADPQYGQRVKGPGGIGRERDLTRQIVTFLVEQQLIGEYSSAHGIRVTAAEVSQTLAQAQTQAGGPVKFRQQLAKSGLTFPEVRMNIERSLLVRKVQAGVTRDRLANSPTLRAEYQQQIDQYTTYTLSHAIFKTKAEADAALARGAPGATFTTIGSGSTPATQLPPAILAVVRKLQPGGLGGPVATTAGEQQGFELIRLDARVVEPFDVVLPQLLTTHVQAEFTAWLGARLKQADIVVNPRFGTFNRSTGAIAPITSTDQLLGGGPAHSSSP